MKKLILAIVFGLVCSKLNADTPADFNYIPFSSYTDVATPGIVQFSSVPIQFVGVLVGSCSANSYLAIWRSTSPTFTADIATQTVISTDWISGSPVTYSVPLFDMKNDSFTYINKVGTAKLTIFTRVVDRGEVIGRRIPGLNSFGK